VERPDDQTSIETLAQIWYRTVYGPNPRAQGISQ